MEHKSEQMMQQALANDWKAQVQPTVPANGMYDEIVWDLYCVRGQEAMHVQWVGDRQIEAVYSYGDFRQYPPRKAAVLKIITGRPDPRKLKRETVGELLEDRSIPFEQDSPAMDILLAVLGKQITWVRKIDCEILSGVVEKETNLGKKYFRVYTANSGRRLLEWQDREGFHAVALDQIVDVA